MARFWGRKINYVDEKKKLGLLISWDPSSLIDFTVSFYSTACFWKSSSRLSSLEYCFLPLRDFSAFVSESILWPSASNFVPTLHAPSRPLMIELWARPGSWCQYIVDRSIRGVFALPQMNALCSAVKTFRSFANGLVLFLRGDCCSAAHWELHYARVSSCPISIFTICTWWAPGLWSVMAAQWIAVFQSYPVLLLVPFANSRRNNFRIIYSSVM